MGGLDASSEVSWLSILKDLAFAFTGMALLLGFVLIAARFCLPGPSLGLLVLRYCFHLGSQLVLYCGLLSTQIPSFSGNWSLFSRNRDRTTTCSRRLTPPSPPLNDTLYRHLFGDAGHQNRHYAAGASMATECCYLPPLSYCLSH